jgi:hypothetical protein
MTDTADLNLVLAQILPEDGLKARAQTHLRSQPRLVVPYSVGIELLLVALKMGLGPVASIGAAAAWFEVERKETLFAAAYALESGELTSPFDALHVADAYVRGVRLHTADRALIHSHYPTVPF